MLTVCGYLKLIVLGVDVVLNALVSLLVARWPEFNEWWKNWNDWYKRLLLFGVALVLGFGAYALGALLLKCPDWMSLDAAVDAIVSAAFGFLTAQLAFARAKLRAARKSRKG